MTAADLPTFTIQLIALLELLGGPPFTASRLMLYCEAVSDLPLQALLRAIQAAARSATFFPKPAELRALALAYVSPTPYVDPFPFHSPPCRDYGDCSQRRREEQIAEHDARDAGADLSAVVIQLDQETHE